ncbi:MAG TPA: ATP-grasp ribosomal peptide maturase [Pseudonocardiaceae bacterium]
MTVLILADELDIAADHMVRVLRDRGVGVCRIDTAWFPSQLGLRAELRGGRWVGELRTPRRVLDLEAVRAVWYRSPAAFRFPAELSPTERRHAYTEAKLGLGGVLVSLPVRWVNHPHRLADAVYKPAQLVTAARCGLAVPPTLVTNEPDAVRSFAGQAPDGVVTKMFGAATVGEEGRRKVAFTRVVTPDELADLRGVEVTAHQFQHWIDKAYDARVIAVGERLFGFAIHAGTAEARVDFRNDYQALRYEVLEPPAEVATGIRRYLNAFGLLYGALDFVVTADGRWIFLECNPGGQYGWLEAQTGVPITTALADLLAEGHTA